ncbi:MAG: hypothetical protein HZA77_06495 [Candidatus Schekmanbacteria bacterium]|nr:hypothetical protein [Candidatus Schekmanbacteria bacterium]
METTETTRKKTPILNVNVLIWKLEEVKNSIDFASTVIDQNVEKQLKEIESTIRNIKNYLNKRRLNFEQA